MKFVKTLFAFVLFIATFAQAQDPMLLVPGVGGSMLQTKDRDPIWVSLERFLASYPNYSDWTRLLRNYTDDSFRQYMLGFFDGSGGLTPAFTDQVLRVPESLGDSDCAYNKTPGGLCGIEYLIDIPNVWWNSYINEGVEWLMKNKSIDYFGQMIQFMEEQGHKAGISLFGFPYDWRMSVRHRATLSRLDQTLAKITNNGEKKVTIISHSMGCLVIKYYLLAYHANATKYINKWIAIGGPFQGAGGNLVAQYFTGYSFGNMEICGCSARNLGVQSPTSFELLANSWLETKLGPVTLNATWPEGSKPIVGIEQILNLATQAYANHSFTYQNKALHWPLSQRAREYGHETRINLQYFATLPKAIKMYALYGSGVDTPYSINYPVPNAAWKPSDLLCEQAGCPEDNCVLALNACAPTLQTVDGDGTVPVISAENPYGGTSYPIAKHKVEGVRHEDLVKNKSDIFRTIEHWLAE